MMNASAAPPGPGRVMFMVEALDLELDGRPVRALVFETPTGMRFTVSEQSNAKSFITLLCDVVRDPETPRAQQAPSVSWAELARDFLRANS